MMINQDYLFCERWMGVEKISLPSNTLFIFERDTECRSSYCPENLKKGNQNTLFVGIVEQEEDIIEIGNEETGKKTLSLHSSESICAYMEEKKASIVYLDVTGMSGRVVAPIMKALLEKGIELRIVYVEPQEYIIEEFQREGVYKDLSEGIGGVDPLPGFAHFMPQDEESLFVALLGFEGWRFSYLLRVQEPADDRIRPVVGVPGYKMRYPYDSLWGNRNAIIKTECWRYLDFAEANSIVDVYNKLDELYRENECRKMVIAPIGTKPHVIGAILYAIKNPDRVEILYDNPKRTLHRTKGVGRVTCCDVTSLYKE